MILSRNFPLTTETFIHNTGKLLLLSIYLLHLVSYHTATSTVTVHRCNNITLFRTDITGMTVFDNKGTSAQSHLPTIVYMQELWTTQYRNEPFSAFGAVYWIIDSAK